MLDYGEWPKFINLPSGPNIAAARPVGLVVRR